MSASIDLILMGPQNELKWDLGKVYFFDFSTLAISEAIKIVSNSQASACLFWDGNRPLPGAQFLRQLLEQETIQVWHAGLKMGLHGLPRAIDFVSPCWMLNCDAPPALESTSWRLSLQACLIRTEVFRQMEGPDVRFQSVEAAGLEMGHRFITRGVFMRHVPGLFSGENAAPPQISFEDEIRFIYYRHGIFWAKWAAFRAVVSGYARLQTALSGWRKVKKEKKPALSKPYVSAAARPVNGEKPKISILIPTLRRYGYLRQLLPQIAAQSVPPLEIIIVDQTPENKRDTKLVDDFRNLPIRLVYQPEPGQCASRNEGLRLAKGDYVLFLDDDDEIFPDFIEKHVQSMGNFQTRISCGVAYERGAGNLPENFSYARPSDVFPTNNTMIEKNVLEKSGLFDLAYNRKQRADGDLGMRIYLSGEKMVLNPEVMVIHHHSASGGLRAHKARKETYAASRNSLWTRQILSDSEIYLGLRYFNVRQVREMVWISALGTFSSHGNFRHKILKFMTATVLFPSTLLKINKNFRSAQKMIKTFSKVETLKTG